MSDNRGSYKYLAKNTGLFTISSFSSKFLIFLLTFLYTRTLTTSEYGTADIINTTATLCIYILTLTISHAVMRFSLENIDQSDLVLKYGLNIFFRGLIALVFSVSVIRFLNLLDWEDYYYLFLILIFASHALEEMLNYYLRAIDKIHIMVITSIVSAGVKLLTSILLLIVFHLGLIGYLTALVLGPMVAVGIAVINIFPLKKTVASKDELKELHIDMIKYSIPAAINAVGWWIAGSVDRYFIVAIDGPSVNGIYSVAYKIPSIIGAVFSIFGQAWGLSAIKEYDSKTKTDTTGFFSKMYSLYSASIVIMSSVLILLNVPIAKIMFGEEFFNAWKYSAILVFGTGLHSLAIYFGGVYSAAKHNTELAYSMGASVLTNIILNAILIPKCSATGAAVATLISYYVVWFTRFILSRKYLHFEIKLLRDHIAFLLVCLQIVCDRMDNHLYIGQILVVVTVLLLYRKEWISVYRKMRNLIKLRLNREKHVGDKNE